METTTIEYVKAAFPQLDEDDSTVLRTLLQQFADELQVGGPRPRWSIMKNMVQMTESQVAQAIDMYESASAPKPAHRAETVDAKAGPDTSDLKQLTETKPASNGHPNKSELQSPEASKPSTSSKPAKNKKSKEEDKEDDEDEEEQYQSWWDDANNYGETDWQWSGSERVLNDCRAHFAQLESRQSLLSQVGISLSRASRDYLESRGIKLKRFLGGYPEEFSIEGSLDGRDSVTHYPLSRSDRGGSEAVLRECRAHLEKQAERQQLLSKLGASLSASSRACLEQKNLKLKRFLMKYAPEFTIEECDDGRDTVTLMTTSSNWAQRSRVKTDKGSKQGGENHQPTWHVGGWSSPEKYEDENPVAKNASWFQ